jgi:phage terminase large subunit GpA-like protein
VHRFCRPRFAQNLIAVVGRDGPGRKLLEAPDRQKYKRSTKKRPTHIVGVDSGKSQLASALRVAEPGPDYVHFPDSVDPIFYDQLTAERLTTEYRKGRATRVWKVIEGRRNEALDTTVYAEAALQLLGNNIRQQLGSHVERVNALGAQLRAGLPVTPRARPTGRRVLSSGVVV